MSASEREFQVFVKPVGARCNLGCSYCYYNRPAENTVPVMKDDLLENYIKQHLEATTDPVIFFSWHGGEPLLAGREFYKKAIKYQALHNTKGSRIINGIQTNGTFLDKEWCSFLAGSGFYIGISIDGPPDLHDKFRRSKDGNPSSQKVMEGYKLLRSYGLNPEILCVVNAVNVHFPERVYGFFKELGAEFITFIPLVCREDGLAKTLTDNPVPPDKFGEFLCRIFDKWLEEDIGRIKIQIIEEALRTAFKQEHTLCIFRRRCGGVPALETGGELYSCDHFVDQYHVLGNINDISLAAMLDSRKQNDFGAIKELTLPAYCRECEVRDMCNGECPKNRFISTPSGEPGLNYLCQGYRMFFNHIKPFADSVRAEWQRQNG